MKKTKKFIPAILCAVIAAVCLSGMTACDKKSKEYPDAYTDWMGYLKDDAVINEVVMVSTHNSGAVECKLAGARLKWLDCQQGTVYDQLQYGIRSFDFRINTVNGKIYCTHGVGAGLDFTDAMRDIKRFSDRHPSEMIEFSLGLYNGDYCSADAVQVKDILNILQPETYAFPSDYNLNFKTMRELRATGKRFIIKTNSEWCDYTNGGVSRVGTWTSEYNFGVLEDGEAMFGRYRLMLDDPDTSAAYDFSFNRASGDSLSKQLPLQFMIHDRLLFTAFIGDIKANPKWLARTVGMSFDFATFDYWQSGNALLLNAAKDLINDKERFIGSVNQKLVDTLA